MKLYIGIKFRTKGQIYYFCSEKEEVCSYDWVVVSTEEGMGLGEVATLKQELPGNFFEQEIKPIERVATPEDYVQEQENRVLAKEAFKFCQEKIREQGLEMKLVDVEVRFDKSKIIFYFTAPSRIDFRELVKVLVNQYRTRIELRQIGVRHEAQILGGIGNCGRVCCCHQFLRKFEPVTIKMAKEQQLFLNPSKISGACGRLLCCLNFEKDLYSDFKKRCPKVGKRYQTSLGETKVLRANMFRDSLIVSTPEGEEKEVTLPEWAEMRQGDSDQNSAEGENNSENGEGLEIIAEEGELQAIEELEDPVETVVEEAPESGKDQDQGQKQQKKKTKKKTSASGAKKGRRRRSRSSSKKKKKSTS